jgi:hypothetical protein
LSARGPFLDFVGLDDREGDFTKIKARLMGKYGTTRGAEFLPTYWGRPPGKA